MDKLLQFNSRTGNGEPLLIQQFANFADQLNLVELVIPPIAASFRWTQLSKLLLPIPEHMRLYTAQTTYFTDGEIPFFGDNGQMFFQLNQRPRDECF